MQRFYPRASEEGFDMHYLQTVSLTTLSENPDQQGYLVLPHDYQLKLLKDPIFFNGDSLSDYQTQTGVLFKRTPCLSDVIQSNLPSPLLTVLINILSQTDGDRVVREMFRDNINRIIVRLFDNDVNPIYVSVEKSLPTEWVTHQESADWVKYLMKAYAAYHGLNCQSLCDVFIGKYVTTITGAKWSGSAVLSTQSNISFSMINYHEPANGIYTFKQLMTMTSKNRQKFENRLAKTIFEKSSDEIAKAKLDYWFNWLTQYDQELKKRWVAFTFSNDPLRMDDVLNFFDNLEMTPNVTVAWNQIKQWLMQNKVFPGKPLSGVYSKDQEESFEKIRQALQDGDALFVRNANLNGKVRRQQVGIIPGQLYTILKVEEDSPHKYVYISCAAKSMKPTPVMNLFQSSQQRTVNVTKLPNGTNQLQISYRSINQVEPFRMEWDDFCMSFNDLHPMQSTSLKSIWQRAGVVVPVASPKQELK